MKKLLLLGAAMIAALALNAQTYDFTKGTLTFNAGSSINYVNGNATADDITWTVVSPGLNTEAGEGAKSFSKAGGFFTFDEISGLEFVALNSASDKDAIRFAAATNGGIVGNGGDDFIKIPNQTAGTLISVTYTRKGGSATNLLNGNKAKDKGAGDANYNLTADGSNTEPAAKGTMVTNKYTVAADGDAYLYITNARVEKIVIGGTSGVDEEVAEGATLEYYSVAGVKLGAPVKGERIVRVAVKDGKKVASDIVIINE
ncbi:MAG: hypothetical protein K6D57_03930 [Paludibacteraceae bacterium]|nr:hypothetical protein [Paludibacteraceae bacterium]